MSEELPYIREARSHLSRLVVSFDQMASRASALHASDKQYSDQIVDLTRRLNETERRASTAEERAHDLQEKADRGDRLVEAGKKLIEALDRLPVSIEGANFVPGATRPAIELYGTYEWQNVVDAKFYVKEELKERRTI